MIKRLLIVGGSHSDIPLIKAGKELGYHVITTGYFPDDLGHKYSDEYYKEDFSDKEAVLNLAKKLNIDAICSSSNDFSIITTSYVAEKLKLKGHDSYEITTLIHHKDKFKEFALKNGISVPYGKSFDSIDVVLANIDKFNFPIIIKPVDLTGGKGISIVNDISELKLIAKNAFSISRAKKIVIEEFIKGSRHGFSAFLRDKKIVFYFLDNEHYFINQYMVSGASTPAYLSEKVKKDLIFESEKMAKLLNLVDGIFHIQFIVNENKAKIIEICRRSPGDFYTELVKIATGIDYPKYIIRAESGLDIRNLSFRNTNGFYLRHCIMSDKTGKVEEIVFDDYIKGKIIDRFTWWKKGDIISDILTQKLGIIFVKFDSMEEMLIKSEILNNYIDIILEDD